MNAATTPWASGRFDRKRERDQLLFGRMFEDAKIELAAFAPQSRAFCIGSAGCTAFALAAAGHRVCALDVNASQVSYMRERACGGAYRRGAAERIIAIGRRMIWPRARREKFLAFDDTQAQLDYWHRRMDTRRFRWLLRVLLNPATLRLAYSPRLIGALPDRLDLHLRSRLERYWAKFPNRRNPYARALFLGDPPETPRFDARLLEIQHGEAAAFLEAQPGGRFDAFTLSNILDATSADFCDRLFAAVRHAATPGALVVLRSFREQLPDGRTLNGTNCASDDRSLLWGIVQVVRADRL